LSKLSSKDNLNNDNNDDDSLKKNDDNHLNKNDNKNGNKENLDDNNDDNKDNNDDNDETLIDEAVSLVRMARNDFKVWKGGLDAAYNKFMAVKPSQSPFAAVLLSIL
jgi:hypothetical protein